MFFSIKSILNKILIFIKYRKSINLFSDANKKNFSKLSENNGKILVEYTPSWKTQIALSYISNILAKKFNSNLVLYIPNDKNFYLKILHKISFLLKLSVYQVIRSYNVNQLIFVENKNLPRRKFFYPSSKKKLLKLKLKNVLIGDLLYDSYLRRRRKYTIDIKSKEFKIFCKSFYKKFYFWNNYIKKNKVEALVCNHHVYENGLPARILAYRKKKVYSAGINHLYLHKYKNFHYDYSAKKRFDKLKKNEKFIAIKKSKKILEKKFKGEKTFDSLLGNRKIISTFKFNHKIKLKKKNKNKINVLVGIHSFNDAPHAFGEFIFPDQYEWLNFLKLKASQLKNYNWFLKIHPIFYNDEINITKKIIGKGSNIKILSKNIDNNYLIKKLGIDFVLSKYGSLVYEYANFGIPSIVIAKNHPYKGYNFVREAKSLKNYIYLLENLKKLKFKFTSTEVCEYYYCRFLKLSNFFNDYSSVIKNLNGNTDSPLIFNYWLKELTYKKNKKLNYQMLKFINSGKQLFEFKN